jgi:hypothetical protein
MSDLIRITVIVIMALFVMMAAGTGLYCLSKNEQYNSGNYGLAAWVCFCIIVGLLIGISKVAGINLNPGG